MPEGPAAVRAGLLTVVALAVAVLSCARAIDPLPGYRRASEAERAAVLRVIADYYTRRERAALTGDASVLFSAYPQLADGEDRARGVNADAFFFERMRAVRIAGLTFDLDGYEPIGVYVRDDTALAFVHGLETWLNGFGPPTKGEFYTRIDLVREGAGWRPIRTDEVMLHEWPPPPTP